MKKVNGEVHCCSACRAITHSSAGRIGELSSICEPVQWLALSAG